MNYYIDKEIDSDFETTVEKTKSALANNGFGIITEIPMHDKLKEKLNVDYPAYLILGACNPKFAYEALKLDDNIGTLLPCNVVIKMKNDNKTIVSAINPVENLKIVNNRQLPDIATVIKEKLELVLSEI